MVTEAQETPSPKATGLSHFGGTAEVRPGKMPAAEGLRGRISQQSGRAQGAGLQATPREFPLWSPAWGAHKACSSNRLSPKSPTRNGGGWGPQSVIGTYPLGEGPGS